MSSTESWWIKPRKVSVVVDNDSWIIPHAGRLVERLNEEGDQALLCRSHEEIQRGGIAFYFGCIKITPPEILARNQRNLVVHASDLPKGRGFSPMTWQVLERRNEIPVCLLEAVEDVDAGPIVYRTTMRFEGHELIEEMRAVLGQVHLDLCRYFLDEPSPPRGAPQQGEPTNHSLRRPEDSRLDPTHSIAEQFDLLRTVDDEAYPAFFDLRGQRYKLTIKKMDCDGEPQ